MNQTLAREMIMARWETLPAHRRSSEQHAAVFVLRLLAEQPELAKIPAQQPYKLIKSWLCETLPQ